MREKKQEKKIQPAVDNFEKNSLKWEK